MTQFVQKYNSPSDSLSRHFSRPIFSDSCNKISGEIQYIGILPANCITNSGKYQKLWSTVGFSNLRSFRKNNLNKNSDATNIIAIVGPILIKNELKSIFAAEPIRIFGGSPISVAAPPIFDTSA
jgi:hypothetical protein